jgi:hypothetical protein
VRTLRSLSPSARAGVQRTGARQEPPDLPPTHPAAIVALSIAAGCILAAVTCRIFDTDFWMHLTVGRAIWQQHAIPSRQLWIWPTLGEPYVLQSWGFRALLWPFWNAGGVLGLQVWRWLSTLAVFGLMWLTLRRQGARGFVVLPVLVLAALTYRQRSMPRPETLAAVLLAAELWVLEVARDGGPNRSAWLIAIACVWANVHISYYLGLVVLAAYALDATWRRGSETGSRSTRLGNEGLVRPPPRSRRDQQLWMVLGACIVASFLNPFGWRALAEPFRFFFDWRHDPMYRTIAEFQAINWEVNSRNGMIPLLIAWPILQAWRVRRRDWDPAETALWVVLTPAPILSQRFIGPWAIAAGFFISRDLAAWVRSRRWPRWTHRPWPRAANAALCCVAFTLIELTRRDYVFGIGLIESTYPEAAADVLQRHGIRGRCFNQFEFGGYLLWRFWPDRGRLPFMANHPEALGREDRIAYLRAMTEPEGWTSLDRRYHFEWALLKSDHSPGDHLLDQLDADGSYALVFADDVAALYLRREGRLGTLADSLRYRLVPGGEARLPALDALVNDDPAARRRLEVELRRIIAESRVHVWATSVLVRLLESQGRGVEARAAIDSLEPWARPLARRATGGSGPR